MDKFAHIQNLADQRGLFFPSAEIHSALSGFWDFGHLATNLRRKIIDLWRKELVRKINSLEIEGCLILPKKNFDLHAWIPPALNTTKVHKGLTSAVGFPVPCPRIRYQEWQYV